MKVRLEFFDSDIEVPYLHQTRDGQAVYRRPYPKGKGPKGGRMKQVLLPVTAPESLAVLCSHLADLDDMGFIDQDQSDYIITNMAARLPDDLWSRIDETPMPEFAADLILYFLPTQFELALLRMTAGPYIAPSWEDYLGMQRVILGSLKARHIEALLQLGEHNDDAQAMYDRFLEETGEEDERPKRR